MPRRWSVQSRRDNTGSSGMAGETSEGGLLPGSGDMTTKKSFGPYPFRNVPVRR
jgi:hypothetical protein